MEKTIKRGLYLCLLGMVCSLSASAQFFIGMGGNYTGVKKEALTDHIKAGAGFDFEYGGKHMFSDKAGVSLSLGFSLFNFRQEINNRNYPTRIILYNLPLEASYKLSNNLEAVGGFRFSLLADYKVGSESLDDVLKTGAVFYVAGVNIGLHEHLDLALRGYYGAHPILNYTEIGEYGELRQTSTLTPMGVQAGLRFNLLFFKG